MTNRVYSFSVKSQDKTSNKLVEEIKHICIRQGLNFSSVCLFALANYRKEVLDKYDTEDK